MLSKHSSFFNHECQNVGQHAAFWLPHNQDERHPELLFVQYTGKLNDEKLVQALQFVPGLKSVRPLPSFFGFGGKVVLEKHSEAEWGTEPSFHDMEAGILQSFVRGLEDQPMILDVGVAPALA